MLELSPDQNQALKNLMDFVKSKNYSKQFITLGGFAGTGKTTIISELRKRIFIENPKINVAFCAFTGKAVQVLKNKLVTNQALLKKDEISTIHGLIYKAIEDDTPLS